MVIILGGTSTYLYLNSKTKAPTPTPIVQNSPTPTANPTVNWRTYTSQTYTFKYPSTWQLSNKATGVKISPSTNNQIDSPSIDFTILQRPFSDSPTGNISQEGIDLITNWKTITIDNVNGDYYQTNQCAPQCTINVDLPYAGGTQTLRISATLNTDTKIFNQILSTFKFTTPAASSALPDTIKDFPVYPGSTFSGKEVQQPCTGNESGYTLCGTTTYTWISKDNGDVIQHWYQTDASHSAWVCGKGGAGDAVSTIEFNAWSTCKKGGVNYGFNLNAKPGNTQIVLSIKNDMTATCPTPPTCGAGQQLLTGDPAPNRGSQCPVYSCQQTGVTAQ